MKKNISCYISRINALIKQSGISTEDLLKNPDKKALKDLQYLFSDLSTYEKFWIKEIGHISPTQSPFTNYLLINDRKVKDDDKLPKEVIIRNLCKR